MSQATVYNNNKAIIKQLNSDNKEMKVNVFGELCQLILDLKLDGFTSKVAKTKAVATLKSKFVNCSYEISLIKLFLIDYDIKPEKIVAKAKELHKFRLSIKKDNLTSKQVIALFN